MSSHTWYLFLYVFPQYFNFSPAIIMILKHATALFASGSLLESALAQAESDYQKSNIGLQVAQYFTAAPQEYSLQQFVDFIMGAHVGVLLHYPDHI
jgi:hypothetical protein